MNSIDEGNDKVEVNGTTWSTREVRVSRTVEGRELTGWVSAGTDASGKWSRPHIFWPAEQLTVVQWHALMALQTRALKEYLRRFGDEDGPKEAD